MENKNIQSPPPAADKEISNQQLLQKLEVLEEILIRLDDKIMKPLIN
jgi:hypothetical protein